jgi:DNA-binding NarL/FixJ family response regulator
MIKILIADDQMLIREGLKTILDLEDDMEVVALAKDGQEAIDMTRRYKPTIIMMDIQMPNVDGITALKEIKAQSPNTHILILSTFLHEQYIVEGMANGASGYLLKDMDTDKMIESIRNTVKGQFVLSGTVASKLVNVFFGPKQEEVIDPWYIKWNLTEREKEIAELLAEGSTSKEIASKLYLTDGTVRNYISAIYQKLEVEDRYKAVEKIKEIISTHEAIL